MKEEAPPSPATLATAPAEYLVPEESALAMLSSCASQIERAATLADVRRVITHAEAINAVMKKIKASERAKLAAARLLIDAEVQLGKITRLVPKAKRGAGAVPGQPTKKTTLRENGIHPFRAQIAEKLAATSRQDIDLAFERSKRKSVFGVTAELGFRQPFEEGRPDKLARDLDFLANEAIDLLEVGVRTQRPPHAGTVAEMRNRLSRLRVRG